MRQSEVSDRLSIQDIIVQSCITIDRRDWSSYERCFTSDAQIDYTHRSAIVTPAGFADRSDKILKPFSATQHFAMNFVIEIQGDVASSQTYVLAQHGGGAPDGSPRFLAGAIYTDVVVRTDNGWRIRRRRANTVWANGDTHLVWGDQGKVPGPTSVGK